MTQPGDAGRSAETGPQETWKESVAFHLYRTAAWLAQAMPEALGRRLFRLGGRLAFELAPGTRAVVARNQAQVLGRPPGDPLVRLATREAFDRYARYWCDSFRFAIVPPEAVAARFSDDGAHHLWRALDGGKGAIVALPHIGNWDAAGPWLRAQGRPIVAVAERLRPPRLYELFVEHRTRLGVEVVGLGDAGVGRALSAALASGSIVALVADRDLTGRGVEVVMFGRPRRVPAGPALLSLTTGAPLLVTPVFQTPSGWKVVMTPPLEIERTGDRRADAVALTRVMAEEFEHAISSAPTDWHMFQPAWDD